MAEYRIVDEPAPGAWAPWVVDPLFPFLASLLGGFVCGWIWFLVNDHAIGNPRRRATQSTVFVGVIGSLLLVGLLLKADQAGIVTPDTAPYAGLVIVVWKILVTYRLHIAQQMPFELFSYFHVPQMNALPILLGVTIAGRAVLSSAGSLVTLILG